MTRGQRSNSHRQSGYPYQYTQHSSQDMASHRLLGLLPAAFTLCCTLDNFQVALHDAYKAHQEWVTGVAAVIICVAYVLVKLYEFPVDSSPWVALKSLIKLPIFPANIRIYRDTAVIVIISYVLLLDINFNYIYLFIFPVIAIAFICALGFKLCPLGEGAGLADSSYHGHNMTTQGSEKALQAMAGVPFLGLLAMAQLDDDAADRFAISEFLLFLSTTLGALTYMMMRLPAGISPGVALASELLHKAFLLLLLLTVHTVAAEALGEDVLLFCMLEFLPVLLWFSLHLDRDNSIISADKVIKLRRNLLIVFGGVVMVVIAPLFTYLATSVDVSGLSWCTVIMKSTGVSGLLTYSMAFMLRQWPGRQRAAAVKDDDVAAAHISSVHLSKTKGGKSKVATGSEETSRSKEKAAGKVVDDLAAANTSSLLQLSKKRSGKGKGATGSSEEASGKVVDNVAAANISSVQSTKKKSGKSKRKGATGSSEGAAKSKEQAAAGSSSEAVHVQLLELWAIFLLIPAAASLLLKIVVAPQLGL